MQEKAVAALLSNLTVLQGYIREANVKILALEDILRATKPHHYVQYRQLALQYENDPKTFYGLEDLAGLEVALLQDRS